MAGKRFYVGKQVNYTVP